MKQVSKLCLRSLLDLKLRRYCPVIILMEIGTLSRPTHGTCVAGKKFETRYKRCACGIAYRARNSSVHSNGVINYAIAIRLFRTVLRDRLKNFSRYNRYVMC